MRCNNCSNFKKEKRIEAGEELTPNVRYIGGVCGINDKNCKATDQCNCGAYSKKE